MADEKLLKLLLEGSKQWNNWREENLMKGSYFINGSYFDLKGADLSNLDLSNVNLSNADLSNANLSNTNLSHSNFSFARLYNANLSKANLFRANLSYANLNNIKLLKADLLFARLNEVRLWKANLSEANLTNADLSKANLNSSRLYGTRLENSNLYKAKLVDADLSEAILLDAKLIDADLTDANLSCAYLINTNLINANLTNAQLSLANLKKANLFKANLSNADLSYSILTHTICIETILSNASIENANIYGISVWNIETENLTQNNLVITKEDEPLITVDNLEVAQFIYLMLNNDKIRDVIGTIAKKGVLILGRFTPERKKILDAIRNKLRENDFVPMMFDFDKVQSRDFTETIKVLAGMSRFVIADITSPKSSPLELQATIPNYKIPFVPIIQKGETPFSMFADLKMYEWVLDVLEYQNERELMAGFKNGILKRAMEADQKIMDKKDSVVNETLDIKDFT